MSRLGGAAAVAPLVADISSEVLVLLLILSSVLSFFCFLIDYNLQDMIMIFMHNPIFFFQHLNVTRFLGAYYHALYCLKSDS